MVYRSHMTLNIPLGEMDLVRLAFNSLNHIKMVLVFRLEVFQWRRCVFFRWYLCFTSPSEVSKSFLLSLPICSKRFSSLESNLPVERSFIMLNWSLLI